MRVAIVHYWLLNMRGGERVIEALCRMFPNADLFTLFYDPARVSAEIRAHRVTASFLQPLRRWYRETLPLMPMALETFDLREYDLVISSESGPAKGVLARSDALHVCYCHTPMRYLWELYPAYRKEWTARAWKRALMTPVANYLRVWDFACAARVDRFVANSANVRRRIERCYRREATVVHPPVNVDSFYWKPPEDYYLIVSELVPYKRIDCAVRAFTESGRRLRVVGSGPEYKRLRALAGKNVEFCGHVDDVELRELYAGCRAFVAPGEEDFGITTVEALASGKPVIAYGRGGSCEILDTGATYAGVLYQPQSEDGLLRAVSRFERIEGSFHPADLRSRARRFSPQAFTAGMGEAIDAAAADRPAHATRAG